METKIPIKLMIDLMKCAEEAGTLEKIDEGEYIRAKGMFSIKGEPIMVGKK